ncbi:hypothetical protein [Archangium violaceum]|uniref:hypothetical protein n=1 Tax=Archangium violaceum TaxID=83451 RepID=UPI0036D7BA6A
MSTDSSSASGKFDLRTTLSALGRLAKEEARTLEDLAAIKSAAAGLQFIQLNGRLDDFLDYLQDVEKAAERVTSVEASFVDMSEAMKWLCAQAEPRFGARVEVAGKPHLVVRQRKEMWFLIPAPPLPSFEELTGE